MIDQLNKHLPLELSAHLMYAGFAQQFHFWGYTKLESYFKEAAEEELGHANAVMHRILQLGGQPNYLPKLEAKPILKRDIPAILKARLDTEQRVLESLTEWMEYAEESEKDFETYRIGQGLVADTEHDLEWTTQQIALIEELTLPNYLQAMM